MIVAFLNQKGGVGKSTISAHFALWHHERGHKVCLIDADAQETITKWVAKSKADDKLPSIELPVAALTDPDDIVSAVRGVHEIYDIVVLDGPGGIKDTSRACCLAADVVVVPAGPSTVDLESTMDTIRVLQNCQMARESARPFPLLVLNRLRNRRYRLTREALEVKDELGIPACVTGLSTLDAYADAIGKGTAVWHFGRSAQRATDEITELLEEITLYAKQLADGQAEAGRAAVRQRKVVSSGN